MAFRTAAHEVSFHQTRDLECIAHSSSIPWNPPTIRYADRTAIAPQMSLLSLYALHSQQSHLFPICAVLTYNDSRKGLHKISQILGTCQCKWLLVSSSAPRTFCKLFFRFLRSFCFARIWLDPLGDQILHHDCISMIVSRFTFFTENFVFCGYQVTKKFCTRYDSAIASSARGPWNFWSSNRFRKFGLWGNE